MISYTEKGAYLHAAINAAGFQFAQKDGKWVSDNETAVQAIIDSYDPLPEAQAEATNLINLKAGEVRTKYVTSVPSQDATYLMKLDDAKAFQLAGYPEASISSYPFIAGEAIALQSTGQVAADLIMATSNQWTQLAAGIENERRKGLESIKRCTVWSDCAGIAIATITNLEAM